MRDVHELSEAEGLLDGKTPLDRILFHGLDLRPFEAKLARQPMKGAVFLGCKLSSSAIADAVCRGGLVFPRIDRLPYDPYRTDLYTPEELFDGFEPAEPCSYCDTPDARIYRHWREAGRQSPDSVLEAVAQRLHDHAMTAGIDRLLRGVPDRVVAVMGGHGMLRSSDDYRRVVEVGRELVRAGFFIATGGGPGGMEAAHLGACFAHRSDGDLEDALAALSKAPSYRDERWLAAAFGVLERHPKTPDTPASLAIPTFLYGHEPPNVFATSVAKYFANSVREEGLVTIATRGIVFAPGSAGTIQEIFQDAAQNHYGTVDGEASPMAFLGERYWTEEKPVYPLLHRLAADRMYGRMMTISDDPKTLARFLSEHSPQNIGGGEWSYCSAFCSGGAE